MRIRKNRSGIDTTMSMIELVIVTGIFAVISIFLMHFFVTAYAVRQKANDISHAGVISESLIEQLKVQSLDDVMKLHGYKLTREAGRIYTGDYTKSWGKCAKNDTPAFIVTVSLKESSKAVKGLYTVDVKTVHAISGKAVYELTGDVFIRGGG